MPVRASITPLSEPGHALLRVTELDAAPDGLTISIQRQQGPDSHLADDGWRRTETWLMPDQVRRRGEVLEFHLGPEICDRLAGVATVRLRVREPDIGVVGTTVVAWPAMLTSGAADGSNPFADDIVRLRRARERAAPEPEPVPEPPPAVEPPPPRPRPELRAARDPMADLTKRRGGTGWMVATAILLILIGGGYYAWTNHFDKPEQAVAATPPPTASPTPLASAEPPKKSVRETVAEYLATKPQPDAMLAKGREFAKDGNMAASFLVFRQAAEQGNAAAQVELASFYDPTMQTKAGFPHDGTLAASWYERAALAGVAEAQRKLGLLFAKGGAGLTADTAKAKSWLQQAAAQNDADAKKALDSLPK
ncbi:tetratricopeptide repeat protein [Reyranella massiliensis]|uniref:tetratricopeptide repeat protein n=1 Tax=Reyranella massiliensis TaxID=445220 RepID=UPI00030C6526|nr:SEL1-like repeat protein [Reyranella massiliensis]